MEYDIGLRGIIYNKYKSLSALSNAIGWTRQKTSNIINRKQEPSLNDVDKLSKSLDIDFETTARFFLQSKSH